MSRRTPRGILLRAAVAAVAAGAVLTGGFHALPQDAPAPGAEPKQEAVGTGTPVQTEAEALAVAKKSNKQVEILGMRNARREIYAQPDGTFTAREYTDPIRTFQSGSWVDIDRTLRRAADGSVAPKATAVGLKFSDGTAGEPFVTMNQAGRELSLTWPHGKLAAPVLDGDTATYRDALPGVDLAVRAEADGFGHLLIVKTPEAAADPRLARIDLGVKADGLKIGEDANGALKAEDAAVGGTVFEAGKPVMWDSAAVKEAAARKQGPKAVSKALAAATADADPAPSIAPEPALAGPGGGGKTSPLGVEIGRGKLSLVPDQKLLTGKDTVFPVVIDPLQRTTSRSAWTGIMSGMPGEQDWKYSGSAGAGKCPTDYSPVSCNGVGVRRLLFTMGMSFYKGKQILGASFSARVEHIYSASPTAEPIRLYRIGGKNYSITSSTDWNSTKDDWADHIGTVDKAISPTSCTSQANLHFEGGATGELTSEVKTAAAEGWSTMTLGLRAQDEGRLAEWKRICGNAYLSIDYNNLPRKITSLSQNPGGVCTSGAGRPYAEKPPQLQAIASDPDHTSSTTDKVKVEFKVDWTDPVTKEAKSYTYLTPSWLAPTSGTRFTHTVKSSIPQNTVIYWSARATDGDGYGPWSYDGDTVRCEFMYDATLPGKPNVLSKQYPSDSVYHDGVGTYGSFTFTPNPNDSVPDTDIVEYRYAFDSTATPVTTVPATSAGGPATVTWMPTRSGRHWVDVIAVDKAKNPSTKAHYEFLVTEGTPVAGQWNLADAATSTEAHDETGVFAADAGTGVTFGVEGPGGKADAAARFDGTAGAYADVNETVLDSSESFSVSAWVRPKGTPTRDMAVVSQDGTGEPGFTLGYDQTAGTWAFSVPVTDVDSLGEWKAVATGVTVVPDQWVLLTGVYDATKSELRLYINKDSKGTASRRSVWKSYGPLQIGRSTAKSGYRDNFAGDLAEVRVFDRVLPAAQVAEMMTVKPERKNYWQLDTANGTASPDTGTGQALTLAGNSRIMPAPTDPLSPDPFPMVGAGHLLLDGDGDYASTATAPVTGAASFTLTARTMLTTIDPEKAQTVLSLPGKAANRLAVRYRPAADETTPPMWELAVSETDAAGATVKTFSDDQELPDTDPAGQHLAVVYDAFANEIRLYVNGMLADIAHGTDDTLWAATGALQVGRSALGGGSEYFAGAVDEVRVYSGAADRTAVQQMANPMALPEM
ncbi:LamG domain-containing protein [Streptomyces genisteinicus]|uniref:LamG domain-containing protein n=1 Tax=Streptomyces genisteinicus TaxID=2768068 RepID=A0A7H0HXW3_9ACTN|nr:LamG domain-containing protein [Streptomyces genisteinicus]QNP65379.1 LamG domain-containing protein [Streptomyces genisteinicus]